jgi:hypothetical protein
MLVPLVIGGLVLLINMVIQVVAVVIMLGLLDSKLASGQLRPGFGNDTMILVSVLLLLFAGHMVQIAAWALLFLGFGEFQDFATAFYHSTVNFATLGYGDIVMSERWRLLGALQAASGVLMFGLSTGTLFTVMSQLFQRPRDR